MTSRVLVSPKKEKEQWLRFMGEVRFKLSWGWSYYAFFCAEYKGGNKNYATTKTNTHF